MTSISPSVQLVDGHPCVSSLSISEHFEKRHTDVLRAIGNIVSECQADFTERNFALSEYTDETGRSLPMYQLSRDGFTLVAMGFTGKKALAWKVRYIEAFNAMEQALLSGKHGEPVHLPITPSTPSDRIPLRALVHAWSQICGQPHQALWPQVKAHFQLSRIDDLPVEWIPDALVFVQSKIDALPKALPETNIPALPRAKPNPLFDFAQAQYINKSLSNKACQLTMDVEKQLNEWISEADSSFNHSRRTQEIATLEDFVFDEHVQVLKRLSHAVFSNLMAFSVQCSSMAFMAQLLNRDKKILN